MASRNAQSREEVASCQISNNLETEGNIYSICEALAIARGAVHRKRIMSVFVNLQETDVSFAVVR